MAGSKLNAVAMGASAGILSAIVVFSLSVLAHTFLTGVPVSFAVGTLFLTYNTTLLSSLILGGSALVGGFIAGFVVCYLYNFLLEWV